jgi:hypothetical protein
MKWRAVASHFSRILIGSVSVAPSSDRQAVAVPARHERRAAAAHVLHLQHEVLQHHVERMAHVRVAIGEGRSVVQDEGLRVLPCRHDLVVNPLRAPARQHARLALGQFRAHREIGLRQQQCRFVVHRPLPGVAQVRRRPSV